MSYSTFTYSSPAESLKLLSDSVTTDVYTKDQTYRITDTSVTPLLSPTYSNLSPLLSPSLIPTNFNLRSKDLTKAFIDSPVIGSVNFADYTTPAVGVYENLNSNPDTVEKMVNYIYYKLFLDDWLLSDLSGLLKYFVYKNGRVSLISNVKQAAKNKTESSQIADKKIDYIEKHTLTKRDMYKILKNIVYTYNIGWIDLHKNSVLLQNVIKHHFKKLVKHKIA